MKQHEVDFNGKTYISSKHASEITGYANDYIGQLARAGKINAKMIGRTWFVETESVLSHKQASKLKYQDESNLPSPYSSKLPTIFQKKSLQIATTLAVFSFILLGGAIATKTNTNSLAMMKSIPSTISYASKITGNEIQKNVDKLSNLSTELYETTTNKIDKTYKSVATTLSRAKNNLAQVFTYNSLQPTQTLKNITKKLNDKTSTYLIYTKNKTRKIISNITNIISSGYTTLTQTTTNKINKTYKSVATTLSHAKNNLVQGFKLTKTTILSASVNSSALTGFFSNIVSIAKNKWGSLFGKEIPQDTTLVSSVSLPKDIQVPKIGTTTIPIQQKTPTPVVQTIKRITINKPIQKVTIEKTIERIISGVTKNDLETKIQQLNNKLTAQIAQVADMSSTQNHSNYRAIALTNRIDNLSGVTISNARVNGITGLTDADIPNNITASNYIPLGGGTLTGSLVGTTGTFSGKLGIGTTSPTDTLSVNGAVYLAQISSPPVTSNRLYNQSGNLYWAGSLIGGASTANWTTSSGNAYRLTGKVGIGTTTPWRTFSVNGSSDLGVNALAGSFTATSTTATSTFTAGVNIGTGNGYFIGGTNVLNLNNGLSVGVNNIASGINSLSVGYGNSASAFDALAFGNSNTASGIISSAGGYYNIASGNGSSSFGVSNTASTTGSSAFGSNIINNIVNSAMIGPSNTAKLTILSTGETQAPFFTATSTTATSTFAGNINIASTKAYKINGVNIAYGNTSLRNYFFGNAGNTTISGSNNIAIGNKSLVYNTLGNSNTAVGGSALRVNTVGSSNTANGVESLVSNTTGSDNTANGYQSLYLNTTGIQNTAVGKWALYSSKLSNGGTAIGYNSLGYNTNASNVTAIGAGAGAGTGDYSNKNSTYIGSGAGATSRTGSDENTFIGYNSGYNVTTGANNILIGANITAPVVTGDQQLNIGNILYGTGVYNGVTYSSLPVAGGKLGIGTTTPWRTLSVAGSSDLGVNALAGSFTATSITATSTFTAGVNVGTGNGYFINGKEIISGIFNSTYSVSKVNIGFLNSTTGITSSAFGYNNTASGNFSSALGSQNTASGGDSSSIGFQNTASSGFSSAFGYKNIASAYGASAFGSQITNNIVNSAMIGPSNTAKLTILSTGETQAPFFTATSTATSTFAGDINILSGKSYNINGLPVLSINSNFGAGVGYSNTASGFVSSAFGYNNTSSNNLSSAFGSNNLASGVNSSAFGYANTASNSYSSAFGYSNTASNYYSSVFGNSNIASGLISSAIGYSNTASGGTSSAVGIGNISSASGSSAFGNGIKNQTANSAMIGPSNTAKITILSTGETKAPFFTATSTTGNSIFNGKLSMGTTTENASLNLSGVGGGSYLGSPALQVLVAKDPSTWNIVYGNNAISQSKWMGNYMDNAGSLWFGDATNYQILGIEKGPSYGVSVNAPTSGGPTGGLSVYNNNNGSYNPGQIYIVNNKVTPSSGTETGSLNFYQQSLNTKKTLARISSQTTGDANAQGNLNFYVGLDAVTNAMTIDTTGNVGIGTTTPYAKLSVVGKVVASSFTATSTTATSTFTAGVNVGTGNGYFIGGTNVLNINKGIAVGYNNIASGISSAAVGYYNTASGSLFANAFGYLNKATSGFSSAFGYANNSTGNNSSTFGYANTASTTGSSAFGSGIINNIAASAMIGPSNTAKLTILSTGETQAPFFTATSTTATSSFAGNLSIDGDYRWKGIPVISTDGIGASIGLNNAYSSSGFAIGNSNKATNLLSNAIGYANTASGFNSVAMGWSSTATSTTATAIGNANNAGGDNSVAIGWSNNAYATGSVVVGKKITNNIAKSVMLGVSDTAKLTILKTGETQIPFLTVTSTTATSTFGGTVGIGTTTPFSKLTVASGNIGAFNGAVCADNGGTTKCYGALTAGVVYGDSSSFVASDVAENYPLADNTIDAGDIVMVSSKLSPQEENKRKNDTINLNKKYKNSPPVGIIDSLSSSVTKAEKGAIGRVIGIISTKPGVLLGDTTGLKLETKFKPVALSGRVPLKVNLEGGDIKKGDKITLSSVSGIGTRATTSTYTIATALQDFNGSDLTNGKSYGKILAFVNLGWSKLDSKISNGKLVNSDFWSVDKTSGSIKYLSSSDLDLNNANLTNIKAITSSLGKWSIDATGLLVVDEVKANKLCLGDTCIDEAQLKTLLGGSNTATVVSTQNINITLKGPNPAKTPVGKSWGDPGATITDSAGKILNLGYKVSLDDGPQVDITNLSIDTSTTTKYTILFTATSTSGQVATATRIVNVYNPNKKATTTPQTIPSTTDTESPTIPTSLTATSTTSQISLNWNPSTDNIAVVGYKIYRDGTQVDTTTDTTYTDTNPTQGTKYTYKVSAYDAVGNDSTQSSEITQSVLPPKDTTPPTIILNGDNPTKLKVGDTYKEEATAEDNKDGNITGNIKITGTVDTSKVGTTTITYNISDMAGNTASTTRTVIVASSTTATTTPSTP